MNDYLKELDAGEPYDAMEHFKERAAEVQFRIQMGATLNQAVQHWQTNVWPNIRFADQQRDRTSAIYSLLMDTDEPTEERKKTRTEIVSEAIVKRLGDNGYDKPDIDHLKQVNFGCASHGAHSATDERR